MKLVIVNRRKLLTGLGVSALLAPCKSEAMTKVALNSSSSTPSIFPISASGSVLKNAHGAPFLMMADSAQTMSTNIAGTDVDTYINTRASQGFNTIQFDLVTTPYVSNHNANYATVTGIRPFTGALVTTPNPVYFALMDSYVQKCLNNNLVAFLNPYETGGGLGDLVSAGATACNTYGQYVGNRYKSFPNVMYQLGNDCNLSTAADYDAMVALAQGIMTADPGHLITIELFFDTTALANEAVTAFTSMNGLGTFNFMSMTGAYTYHSAYSNCLQAYNKTSASFLNQAGTNENPRVPSILLEANYEFENDVGQFGGVGGTLVNLRRQSYWASLCGQSGQIYGNGYVWGFFTGNPPSIAYPATLPGWSNNLATPGYDDLLRWKNFFNGMAWQNLIPDQGHLVGTAGFGTGRLFELPEISNYVTVAADSLTGSAHLAVAYFPGGRGMNTLTVEMSKFAGSVTAKWFDPTNATLSTISGSPFSNTGTHTFTPTGNNSAGDPDWVLLVTA
jgi:hypothetical protein